MTVLRLVVLFSLCWLLHITCGSASYPKRSFTIDYKSNQFLKDGDPFRYIAGEMHYFRVPSEYWSDRLLKLRMGGMNAVQTYVAWNVHEPFKGEYHFSGDNDLVKFIKLAQLNDLLVILRPGPYICAEWEYGGFPYWIMKEVKPLQLRTSSDVYLKLVDKWMSVLLRKMKPLLYSNGGPIISVQVENEYGSYGEDHVYMEKLKIMFRKYLGDDVILFTTDGADNWYLDRGAIPSLYATVDFGDDGIAENYFKVQRKYEPKGPLVNSEYYTGWLDHWSEAHSIVNAESVAKMLDDILSLNASVALYMYHGGTNFGFMNGANYDKYLQPQPTSYDYDAPLTECGDITEKYLLIQDIISKYEPMIFDPPPTPSKKGSYGIIKASKTISLYKLLNKFSPIVHHKPLSFEAMDIPYGYVLYRTSIQHLFVGEAVLTMKKMHDRAVVLVDQLPQNIVYTLSSTIKIMEGTTLDIIVENQGRINYGDQMKDTAKGILDDVTINGQIVKDWKMYAINETMLLSGVQGCKVGPVKTNKEATEEVTEEALAYRAATYLSFLNNQTELLDEMIDWTVEVSNDEIAAEDIVAPSVSYFNFSVAEKLDTFLKLDAWTKGFVLVNGFNVGRYWTVAGPQRTLYVPGHLLKEHNTLVLFETDALPFNPDERFVEFVDKPIWMK